MTTRRVLDTGIRTLLLVAWAPLVGACEAPGRPELPPLVSPDGTYVVRLSGHVTRPIFFEHPLRAEVYKEGALHVPARQIFLADLFETAFRDRYGGPEWVGTNVIRFPARRTSSPVPLDSLTVRNTGSKTFRSIRIETGTDMFMIVDLAAGAELALQLTGERRSRRLIWFDVVIESGDPAAPLRGSGAFGIPRGQQGPYRFSMHVAPNGVEFSETTGRGELLR